MRTCALLVALALAVCTVTAATVKGGSTVNVNFEGLFKGLALPTGSCHAPGPVDQCDEQHVYALQTVDVDQIVQSMPGQCPSADRPGSIRWCAKPHGTVDIQITVLNTGSVAWPRNSVTMSPIIDDVPYETYFQFSRPQHHEPVHPEWRNLVLHLTNDVPVGGQAVFRGLWHAPAQIGIHELYFQAASACGEFADPVVVSIEVTCSDFLFCNGEERFVDGECVSSPLRPCQDDLECTRDICDETTRTCSIEVIDTEACETCNREKCTPQCDNPFACGEDGCGGFCACSSGLSCNHELQCVDPSTIEGTCQQPLTFVTEERGFTGEYIWNVDTTTGVDQVHPSCNDASTAPERIYAFTVPSDIEGGWVGVEVKLYDARLVLGDSPTDALDALLEIREGACLDDEFDSSRAWCSDDSTPPGATGSRVTLRALAGQTYYMILDSYSKENQGEYIVHVRFTAGYVPGCDARWCGPDASGLGDCGSCASGFECHLPEARCYPENCVPNCDGRCGDDGCGGECPTVCENGELCVKSTGQCAAFPVCDNMRPSCEGGCGEGEYCANDCQCHALTEELPDFIIRAQSAVDTLKFEQREFDSAHCAIVEGCVGGTGLRRLLRFTVEAANQGFGTLTTDLPEDRPDMFVFSKCHGHYHYEGFASYELLAEDHTVVAKARIAALGHKQAYCLEDSRQFLFGPQFNCEAAHFCDEPGISSGWSDFYGVDLDCQWVDITDVPAGKYTLRLEVNAARRLVESNFDNNAIAIEVTIPEPSDSERGDAAASRNKKGGFSNDDERLAEEHDHHHEHKHAKNKHHTHAH